MPKTKVTIDDETISLASVVRRNEDVFSAAVGGELVIFDQGRDDYVGSGPVGEAIWSLLEQQMTVAALCDAIQEQFEVERATCEADTLAFLAELRENGYLRLHRPGAP